MSEKEIGVRISLREEGDWVIAYLAQPGMMDGSYMLGSILTRILEKDDEIYLRWKAIMKDVIARGLEPPAPPHDKSGNG
jgi:hypothetical protein